MTLRTLALITLVFSVTLAPVADAQIRGMPMSEGYSRWWISGGANAAVLSDINDGATRSTWRFGNDPALLVRGSLEKSLDEATTLGLSVAYGKVDVNLVPFTTGPLDDVISPLPVSCQQGCSAQLDLWSAMLQFRSGGGPGFHSFFEGNGGVTAFRNMRTRSDATAIGKPSGSMDLSGTLGGGFGYTLKPGFVVTLVQDFGIGFHSKADLPEGTSRSWRVRTTRAALRFAF